MVEEYVVADVSVTGDAENRYPRTLADKLEWQQAFSMLGWRGFLWTRKSRMRALIKSRHADLTELDLDYVIHECHAMALDCTSLSLIFLMTAFAFLIAARIAEDGGKEIACIALSCISVSSLGIWITSLPFFWHRQTVFEKCKGPSIYRNTEGATGHPLLDSMTSSNPFVVTHALMDGGLTKEDIVRLCKINRTLPHVTRYMQSVSKNIFKDIVVQNEVALSTEAEALVSRAHAILVSAGVVKSDATSASAAYQVQDMRLGHMPSMDELLRQVGGMDWATPISVVTQNAVPSGSENLEVA